MSKRVQFIGHVATAAKAFIGLVRELTVDTDNKALRLHDGVTPGGHEFPNRATNDELYQPKSSELLGLTGFQPSDRGFLARLGPATFRVRTIEVETAQLVLTNSQGFAGNPKIEWASEITSDHTFSGSIDFSSPIVANSGLVGDVTGNVVGDVTGNLTGDVVGNLTGNAAGDHTGTFTGDVDVQGATLAMDDETIQLSWLAQAIIDYIDNAGAPIGTIVAYGGAVEDIPANWYLCDGSGGTPDLRDKFIISAGTTYAVDATGGTSQHNHTPTIDASATHTHTGTVGATTLSLSQIPAHDHGNGVGDTNDRTFCYGSQTPGTPSSESMETHGSTGTVEGLTEEVGGGGSHDHSITIDAGGSHAHTASIANTSHIPPYYALMYIMKVA